MEAACYELQPKISKIATFAEKNTSKRKGTFVETALRDCS